MRREETGAPVMPGWKVYPTAREVRDLAHLAMERAIQGPGQDLPGARGALDRARALLGNGFGPTR